MNLFDLWIPTYLIGAIAISYYLIGYSIPAGILSALCCASTLVAFKSYNSLDTIIALFSAVIVLFAGKMMVPVPWLFVLSAFFSPFFCDNGSMWGTYVGMVSSISSPPVSIALLVLAVFSKSSIGIGISSLVVLYRYRDKLNKVLTASLLLGALISTWVLFPEFFSSTKRFDAWVFFIRNVDISLFGSGLGLFPAISYMLQSKTGFNLYHTPQGTSGFFSFLHNDFLQCFFDLGVVGLLALLLTIMDCSRKKESRLPVLCCCLAMAMNSPIHWPIHSLFIGYVFWESHRKESLYTS